MSFLKSLLSAAVLTVTATTTAAVAGPHGTPRGQGHHERHIRSLVDTYLEVINAQDVARFPEVFAADYQLDSTAGTFDGLESFTGVMSALYAALPDIQYTVDEVLVDGNAAIVRYHYTGTHLGSFLGIPATGAVVTCRGLEIDRFDDGLMVATRNFTDYFCLLSGLGAL